MTTQPHYFRYLESAKQAETVERLRREGYTVEEEKKVESVIFDLVATKNGRTIVYEFKSAGHARFSREKLLQLQETARRAGYEFHIVVAVPPPRVHVEIDQLKQHLLDHIMENTPNELDQLSTHTRVCGLSDLEISDLRMKNEEIRVSGTASVDVELQYGSGSDGESGHGSDLHDSYPLRFTATLEPTGELISVGELAVDTSSFYE